ncbi:hypothetical protein OC861_005675 [Tilletia horrida]|nr:hypothetical protein OC861_005675 [Tilletia horrida]
MIGAVKAWAWCVLLIIAALSSSLATPFTEQNDLSIRAPATPSPSSSTNHTGAYVGSRCKQNSDCFSALCLPDGSAEARRSLLPKQQLPIPSLTGIGANCTYNADCQDGYDFGYGSELCINGKCRIMTSYPCTSNSQCSTGRCFQNTCREQPQPPNAPCQADADCISGSCLEYPHCTQPDGAFDFCPTSAYIVDANCARYPLGHSCENPGDCDVGQCKNGKCVNSTIGDPCQEPYQCTSPSLCGSNNTCVAAPSRPLYPTEECNPDDPSQCLSGTCSYDVRTKDSDGVIDPYTGDGDLSTCTYLPNGVSGCRDSNDCDTGICKNSTCVAGADGDRCQANGNCQNLCGLDGFCYTPTRLSHGNEPCKTNDQCISGTCLSNIKTSRPGVDTSNHSTVVVPDSICEFSLIGHKCETNSDCVNGGCVKGTCTYLSTGQSCTAASQCTSEFCGLKNGTEPTSSSTPQTCQLGPAGQFCKADDHCYSGTCIPSPCYGGYGGHGQEGYYSCNPMCAAVAKGGKCRSGVDCDSGVSCTKGYCGGPPKTTTTSKTTTSSTSTSLTTSTTSKTSTKTTKTSLSTSANSTTTTATA